MWNSTKIKREKQRQADEQRRLDDMAAAVGMPPNWEPIGRDKKGWVYRWRDGDSFVEHRGGSWFWYTGIKTKHFTENGAFECPVACAAACVLTMEGVMDEAERIGRLDTFRMVSSSPSYQNIPRRMP